jgi:hypothetical protein
MHGEIAFTRTRESCDLRGARTAEAMLVLAPFTRLSCDTCPGGVFWAGHFSNINGWVRLPLHHLMCALSANDPLVTWACSYGGVEANPSVPCGAVEHTGAYYAPQAVHPSFQGL